jgi:hypothetical protein
MSKGVKHKRIPMVFGRPQKIEYRLFSILNVNKE